MLRIYFWISFSDHFPFYNAIIWQTNCPVLSTSFEIIRNITMDWWLPTVLFLSLFLSVLVPLSSSYFIGGCLGATWCLFISFRAKSPTGGGGGMGLGWSGIGMIIVGLRSSESPVNKQYKRTNSDQCRTTTRLATWSSPWTGRTSPWSRSAMALSRFPSWSWLCWTRWPWWWWSWWGSRCVVH